MPHPNAIDPKTGKRHGWVDPGAAREAAAKNRKATAALRTAERAMQARDDLMVFTEFTTPDPAAPSDPIATKYSKARFHELIAKHLEEVERGDIRQLIFCMPPRHGKSELATRRLTAWYTGRHPDHDIIVAAASDTLAMDFGADVRSIITSPRYRQVFPQHRLRRGGTAKDNIQTDQGGRLVFAGRGGTINGRGAHLLLVDDLIRGPEDANSQALRDQMWEWLMKVAFYRRMGKKLTIITMTRWHSDDVIGRLTDPENPYFNEEESRKWKIIRLPALAEEDDPLGRAVGEALWPDGPSQYDEDYLRGLQRQDPLGFAALQQQRPSVADGVLFRRENVRYYTADELPANLRVYGASDHAVGQRQRNDPSCLLKIGVDVNDDIYLLDCDWRRMPADEAVEAMLTMQGTGQPTQLWWAERGHITMSIGPFLRKRMLETGRYINIVETTPIGDKTQRAQSIAARVSMGKVFFPKYAPWTEKAVSEMMAFPNGTHDDFVDALAYIGMGLGSLFGAGRRSETRGAPRFGTLGWVKEQSRWQADEAARRAGGGF